MSQIIETINTNIFNIDGNECNGYNDCSFIKRIMTALAYYHNVSSNESQTFIYFCDKYYSKRYLQDYIHLMIVHKNDINKNAMVITNKTCAMVSGCLSTTRHYRDRSVNDGTSNLYIDIFDSVHFYLYHMEECGLRISLNLDDFKDIDSDEDYTNCKDQIIAFVQNEIESRKEKCEFFKRLDNRKNSKFNIMQVSYNTDEKAAGIDEEPENKSKIIKTKENKSVWKNIKTTMSKYFSKKEQKEQTFTDDILDHIRSVGVKKNIVTGLKEFLLREEYDTDSINNDVEIYDDDKKSNLLEAVRYSLNCIEVIKSHMKMI
eukprot:41652_1